MSIDALQRSSTVPDSESVHIGASGAAATLNMPARPLGLIVFCQCHPRKLETMQNRFLAQVWRAYGLGSLQVDLVQQGDAGLRRPALTSADLGARLKIVLAWLTGRADLAGLPLGLFGIGMGTAAALRVAACEPERVGAVVSRGGRPDLVQDLLPLVRAPTLLIVGERDRWRLEQHNRSALRALQCETRLDIVPNAGHMFNEPGTLDVVVSLAGHWFERHLAGNQHGASA